MPNSQSKTLPRTGFFSRKMLVRSVQIFAGIAVVYLSIAAGLIYWPRSAPFPASDQASSTLAPRSEDVSSADARASFELTARDGEVLATRRFGSKTDAVILLLHGVASNQAQMFIPAQMLNEATGLEVVTLDLRGHGQSGGARNDVQYIGQYEDDVEDTIRALFAEVPDRRVILAGHSMGGGIAMRYALKDSAPEPSAYLLFAPNFGEGPTEGGGDSEDVPDGTPSFVHFDLPRMIGQIMMNVAGIHAFDHEPILFFNFPPRMQAYSYRAVMSGQPIRPQTSDQALQMINVPLLVVVGKEDEVFNGPAYDGFVSAHSDGETRMIEGEDHVSILFSKHSYAAVRDWFASQGFGGS